MEKLNWWVALLFRALSYNPVKTSGLSCLCLFLRVKPAIINVFFYSYWNEFYLSIIFHQIKNHPHSCECNLCNYIRNLKKMRYFSGDWTRWELVSYVHTCSHERDECCRCIWNKSYSSIKIIIFHFGTLNTILLFLPLQ